MTSFATMNATEQDRLEAAAEWRLRLDQESEQGQMAEFLEWLRSPENREAFDLVSSGLTYVDQFQASPELLAMRQSTIARLRRRGAERWKPFRKIATALAAVLIVGLISGGVALWYLQPTTYDTQVGERRAITLDDGSRLSLDSNTEVTVRFTKSARNLELVRGRAHFDVAHDVTRPFSVMAGTETVVAVGTAFDVERLGPKVVVTLIQGHVVIKSAMQQQVLSIAPVQQARPPVALSPGQEMVSAVNQKPVISAADLKVAAAWQTGQLVFHNESLAEAIEQVNRYASRPLTVDPSIADIRVTGVFNAGDVNSFLSAVTGYLPIVATTTGDDQILLAPRAKGS